MIDLVSVAVGVISGGSIGYIAASLRNASRVDDLEYDLEQQKEKYEQLYRDYSRLTDRDERGRFVKREGNNK